MFGHYHKRSEPKVTYTIITDVTEEVISLADAKAFMGLDFDDFDSLVEDIFIPTARSTAEIYTGLSIGVREIQLAGDYKCPDVYLPFNPGGDIADNGKQTVGYTADNLPAGLKLAILNMIHIAFENRTTGLDYGTSLKLLDPFRRRVGL